MEKINIERNPGENRQKQLGVSNWPIWTKEASEFPWPDAFPGHTNMGSMAMQTTATTTWALANFVLLVRG